MARPTSYPVWATNVNYAGGPQVGTATKVIPSAGRMQDGWRNNDVPPAQEQNYWQNLTDLWVEWFDAGDIVFANLAATTGVSDNARVYVPGIGWYKYSVATPFTADTFWVITATGMGVGQWTHELVVTANLKRLPAIGPTPGESYSAVTPTGRINKDNIDHGYRIEDHSTGGASYNTTSGSAVTLVTFTDVGSLAVADLVRFSANITARGNSAAAFTANVWLEYTQNGGGAWTVATMTQGGQYGMTADNLAHTVAASFTKSVSSAGDFQVRLRANSSGGNSLVVDVDSWSIWVNRP